MMAFFILSFLLLVVFSTGVYRSIALKMHDQPASVIISGVAVNPGVFEFKSTRVRTIDATAGIVCVVVRYGTSGHHEGSFYKNAAAVGFSFTAKYECPRVD